MFIYLFTKYVQNVYKVLPSRDIIVNKTDKNPGTQVASYLLAVWLGWVMCLKKDSGQII